MLNVIRLATSAVLIIGALSVSSWALAHCDTLDGPVVKAARRALETGNVNHVLMWVQPQNEAEINEAFRKTLAVRKLDPAAQDLADTYFFETLVRIHREGEHAPYTGLKPAQSDPGPAVRAADTALESGSVDALVKLLVGRLEAGVREQFKDTVEKKHFKRDDVDAGRQYVKHYVEFVHYVERLFEAAETPAHGHYPEMSARERSH